MKNIIMGLAASVALVSASATAFACPQRGSADNSAENKGVMVLAQASGGGGNGSGGGVGAGAGTGAGGTTGGSGNNNTVEKQTGKATSDTPSAINPGDVQKNSSGGASAPAVPDNRNPAPTGNNDSNAVNPTVK